MTALNYDKRKPLKWLADFLARTAEGKRNHTLLWATCTALEEGHDRAEVAQVMYAAAIEAGLEHRESRRTIQSAFQIIAKKQRPPTFEEFFPPHLVEEINWIKARIAQGISLTQAQAEWDGDHPPKDWWEDDPEEDAAPEPPPESGILHIDFYRTTIPTNIVWIGTNFAYRGGVSLVTGPAKGGKSTLIAQLQWAREDPNREFLGEHIPQGPMLLITEEGGMAVLYKMSDLHGVYVYDQRAAEGESFDATLAKAEAWFAEHPDGVIVIDTLAIWAGIEDENDASATTAAIKKVMRLAQTTDAPVIIVHHSRKSGGSHGEAIRGSSAILATVDVGIELKRTADNASDDRYLDVLGRVMLPFRLLLAFDRDSHRYEKRDIKAIEDADIEAELAGIPATGEGMDREELAEHWGLANPRKRIDHLVAIGRMRFAKVDTGRGGSKKFVYWSIPPVYLTPEFETDDEAVSVGDRMAEMIEGEG